MRFTLTVLVLLYLAALHCSMAAMEILGWSIVAASIVLQFRKRDFHLVKKNRDVLIWMAVMAAAITMSLLVNPLYKSFTFQLGFMRWVFIFWGLVFALDEIWDEHFERMLVALWAFSVAVTGAYAGVECFTGKDLIRHDAVFAQGGGIFKATGWFSESLTFAYNFGISLFTLSRPALKRYGYYALPILLLGGLGLISSISRGAWLASILVTLLYLGMERRILVLPAAAFFYVLKNALIWYSVGFGGKIEGMESMKVDHSSSMRLDLWQGYLNMFYDHPLFGVGVFQGEKFLPEYYARLGIEQEFVSHAHNNLLQFLGGGGIFGLIAYCGLNFIFLRRAWRLRKVTAWGWAILMANIFMQLGGLTEANFIDAEVTHMFVFTWAILVVLEGRYLGDGARDPQLNRRPLT